MMMMMMMGDFNWISTCFDWVLWDLGSTKSLWFHGLPIYPKCGAKPYQKVFVDVCRDLECSKIPFLHAK